jgi:hypothetical protein
VPFCINKSAFKLSSIRKSYREKKYRRPRIEFNRISARGCAHAGGPVRKPRGPSSAVRAMAARATWPLCRSSPYYLLFSATRKKLSLAANRIQSYLRARFCTCRWASAVTRGGMQAGPRHHCEGRLATVKIKPSIFILLRYTSAVQGRRRHTPRFIAAGAGGVTAVETCVNAAA